MSCDGGGDKASAPGGTHEPIPPIQDDDDDGHNNNNNNNSSSSSNNNRDPSELPFLVTHWLSTVYQLPGSSKQKNGAAAAPAGDLTVEQKDAMDKIRRAAADLASAFSTLGAFGTASRVSVVCAVLCGVCVCCMYTYGSLAVSYASDV
jgi:hypothetical protein